MANRIFSCDPIRRTIEKLNWVEIAKKTLEAADEYMPGAAYLDHDGKVRYAETMSEVDGLILCLAEEVTDGHTVPPFGIASWVKRVSREAYAEADRAFRIAYYEDQHR